jgi:hypothetical protein
MALTLAWVGSASAISISLSFTDLIPGANIVVGGVPGVGGVPPLPPPFSAIPIAVFTSPELATVSVGNVTGVKTEIAAVALTEPGSSTISDLLTVSVFSSLGAEVRFQSDTETGLTPNGFFTTFLPETGLPQIALHQEFSISIGGLVPLSLDLTVNTASDLDNGLAPVPEPSTLLLFGSSLAGFGAMWRRYRHT